MKNFLFGMLALVAVLLLVVAFNLFRSGVPARPLPSIAYSDFIEDVEAGQVGGVAIRGPVLTGTLQDGRAFQTYLPDDPALMSRLLGKKLRIAAAPVKEQASALRFLLSWLPLLVFSGVWLWFISRVARALRVMTHAIEVLSAALADRGQRNTPGDAEAG